MVSETKKMTYYNLSFPDICSTGSDIFYAFDYGNTYVRIFFLFHTQ